MLQRLNPASVKLFPVETWLKRALIAFKISCCETYTNEKVKAEFDERVFNLTEIKKFFSEFQSLKIICLLNIARDDKELIKSEKNSIIVHFH